MTDGQTKLNELLERFHGELNEYGEIVARIRNIKNDLISEPEATDASEKKVSEPNTRIEIFVDKIDRFSELNSQMRGILSTLESVI